MDSTDISVESFPSAENKRIMDRILSRKAKDERRVSPQIACKPVLNNQIGRPINGPLKKSQSLTPTNSSRFVLNDNTKFSSLRIEDPKKVEDTHDSDVKLMLSTIPEISRHLIVCGKLGEGTFSKVFRAKDLHNSSKEYALKYVIPTIKPSRIASEIRFLREMRAEKNIIGIETCFYSRGHTVVVMPIFPHQKFTDYVNQLSVEEVKHYMKNLLIALEKVHSRGLIHRDIKPANFLYDRKNQRYALVDFGLAQPERELLVRTHTNSAFRRLHSNKEKAIKPIDNKFKVSDTSAQLPEHKPSKRLALIDCTIAANNFCDNKWQIRKRSRNEAKLNDRTRLAPKRARVEPAEPEPSVFNSPITPTVFKSPTTCKPITNNLTTPVKCGLNIIPETPPKTLMKNLNHDFTQNQIKDVIPKEVNETPKSRYKTQKKSKTGYKQNPKDVNCECLKANQVCDVCKAKPELVAPRAGTPGFRAPEVLLKYLLQTTLIDIWSAGVIFASLLSGRYPFFRNIDDMTALAEIITVMGSKRVQRAAKELNKTLVISNEYPGLSLKDVCQRLRADLSFNPPDTAYDLLDKLLDPNPKYRWTATKALNHPFFDDN